MHCQREFIMLYKASIISNLSKPHRDIGGAAQEGGGAFGGADQAGEGRGGRQHWWGKLHHNEHHGGVLQEVSVQSNN